MQTRELIEAPLCHPQVLLIEDDPEIRQILADALGLDGLRLSAASNGREALEAASRDPFELILLDLGLPGLNGLKVLDHLKQHPVTHNIPVVVITAWSSTEDKLHSFELGAVDYITKPFEPVELRARVRSILKTKRLQDELTR